VNSGLHTTCDRALATTSGVAASEPATKHLNLVLATTILASSLAFIDGSVVNVGLPAIGRSFHTEASDLQWVVNAYLLPLSALLLLGGAAGDRFGRRFLLVVGVGVFALASCGCAIASTLTWLLLARGLQGLGAALLMPNSLAILGGAFSGAARGRAIGIWAAMGAVTGAAAPVLGGWLIDTVGWRAIFFLNLPLAAAAIGLALGFVRDAPPNAKQAPLDLPGGIMATASLGVMTWGLTVGSGSVGWTTSAAMAFAGGAALLLPFVVVEKWRGDSAMVPLTMFASRPFIGLTIVTLLLYGALGGLLLLVPYVLIEGGLYSATAAGGALLPLPLILAITSPWMGQLAGQIGARIPLTVGPLVVAIGFLLLLRIEEASSYWTTALPAILLVGLGMAGAVAPLTTAVLASVDARHMGSASGLNSAVARTGSLIATALLGAVLAASGSRLMLEFHVAAVAGAVAAIAASLCTLLFIRGEKMAAQSAVNQPGG
jgi:EmrB/QacA subfamily drug resistance transporter